MLPFYRTWIEIDDNALRGNARAMRSHLAPGTRLIAVVKANAYGHGLSSIVKTLKDFVDGFAVNGVDEALLVRKYSEYQPILLLARPALTEAPTIVESGFSVVLDDMALAEALSEAATRHGKAASVHVKLDTGMGRRGVAHVDVVPFLSRIATMSGIHIEAICTHFANADDDMEAESVRRQLHEFREGLTLARWCGLGRLYRHAAASAAALRFPETHFDAVRVGIALYGIAPNSQFMLPDGFSPALSWRTRVASLRALPLGATVGYGSTETLARDTIAALLPVGYADGYDRKLSSRGNVLLRGKRARVLGRVSMNLTAVDATDIPYVSVGDTVTLLGKDGVERISAEEIARMLETIPYEVVSRIPGEFPRSFMRS